MTNLPLGFSESTLIYESNILRCIPAAALYSVNVTFSNSVSSIAISTGPPRTLSNTALGIALYGCPDGCDCCNFFDDEGFSTCTCIGAPQWTQAKLNWFRDNNILGIIDAAMTALAGAYTVITNNDTDAPTFQVNTTLHDQNYTWMVEPATIADDLYASPSDTGEYLAPVDLRSWI